MRWSRGCATKPRRWSRPSSSRPRSRTSATWSRYLDQPEFKTFWDADAQARRSGRAVDRQGGGYGAMDRRTIRDRHCRLGCRHLVRATRTRRRHFPSRAITILNAFPPGGANDLVTRPIAIRARTGFQAAGRGRDQGRRGRRGRRAGGRQREAGRLHAALAQQRPCRLRRGRQAVRAAAEDDARRFHSAGAALRRSGAAAGQRSAAVQDAGGVHRRRQEAARQDRLSVGRPLWREPSAGRDDREGGGHPGHAASADRGRRAGDHRDARQQRADDARRPCRRRSRTSRPASCARSLPSAPSDPRRCPTCRP